MLRFSRALYRELAPAVQVPPGQVDAKAPRRALLEALEANIRRLAYDPDFARPGRRIYLDIRMHFAPTDLPRVRRVIEQHLRLAADRLERARTDLELADRRCVAITREGKACERQAISAKAYCPSHKHLEDFAAKVLDPEDVAPESAGPGQPSVLERPAREPYGTRHRLAAASR